MRAAVDLADNWLNLRRLELQVYIDNEPAIHLYQKFGFEIEGKLADFAFRDGQYVDAYMMAKWTNETAREEKYYRGSALCGMFLMTLQLNGTDCRDFPEPDEAVGGTPLSFVDNNIRIDYVQHAVVVLVKIMVYAHTEYHI